MNWDHALEALGTCGALTLLAAYASQERLKRRSHTLYHALNMLGASCVGAAAAWKHAWSPFALEAAWALIALVLAWRAWGNRGGAVKTA